MSMRFDRALLILGLLLPLTSLTLAAEAADAEPKDPAVHITIGLKSRHPAIELAGAELSRYLGLMAGNNEVASIVETSDHAGAIQLGLMAELGLPTDGLRDPARGDAIYADVQGSKGVIAGSNPRSVLFATYRFLEACGCRWIRPGKDGDYVPSRAVNDLTARFADKAVYRFRGNNNCGTYSLDQVLDKIAWAPKVGLNTFFHEFLLPRQLYNGYYNREYPSLREPQPRTDEEIRAYHELSIREIKRRGMLYHAAGHGWTSLVVGLPESESDHWARPAVPPGKERFLALVNGKRDLSRGPTFTDLCYGNPACDTDALAREYFAGAFGDDAELVRQYTAALSDLFAPLYLDRDTLFGKDSDAKQAALAKVARVPQVVADFRPVIARHLTSSVPAHQQSWKLLSLHADMTLKLAAIVQSKAQGNQNAANASWKELIQEIAEHGTETDSVFDIRWFDSTCRSRLRLPAVEPKMQGGSSRPGQSP